MAVGIRVFGNQIKNFHWKTELESMFDKIEAFLKITGATVVVMNFLGRQRNDDWNLGLNGLTYQCAIGNLVIVF